jgi:hypothetical protein
MSNETKTEQKTNTRELQGVALTTLYTDRFMTCVKRQSSLFPWWKVNLTWPSLSHPMLLIRLTRLLSQVSHHVIFTVFARETNYFVVHRKRDTWEVFVPWIQHCIPLIRVIRVSRKKGYKQLLSKHMLRDCDSSLTWNGLYHGQVLISWYRQRKSTKFHMDLLSMQFSWDIDSQILYYHLPCMDWRCQPFIV